MSELTALIADDVKEMRILLRRTLESLGVKVVSMVEDGNKALESIKESRPDLCFLDIQMPGLSGLDVLEKIKEQGGDVFTVIVSGHSTLDNVRESISRGAQGFIVKPYSHEKIKQVITKFKKKN